MSTLELKEIAPNKNASGQHGPICNNCAGYGYTLTLGKEGGGSAGCHHCGQSGVARLDNAQLSARLGNLEAEIHSLKQIIMKELGKKNV